MKLTQQNVQNEISLAESELIKATEELETWCRLKQLSETDREKLLNIVSGIRKAWINSMYHITTLHLMMAGGAEFIENGKFVYKED